MSSIFATRQLPGLIGWLALTAAAAAIGALASVHAADFYGSLARPRWAPPSSVFGPVWTVLYLLMAVSAWLVWSAGGFDAQRRALALFLAQLALNALWSWLFFAWRQGAWALVDSLLLLLLVAATTAAFWRVRMLAGALLLPYLAWVGFATALNFTVWRMNPAALG
jgi:tryptophan-rich sensory protein